MRAIILFVPKSFFTQWNKVRDRNIRNTFFFRRLACVLTFNTKCWKSWNGYSITLISLFFSYRSACYFTLKQYQACLTDIALALEAGYPTHMIYKLYIRKCKCLLELCRIPDAQEAFDKAIDAIDRSGLKKDLRKVLMHKFLLYFLKKAYMYFNKLLVDF